MNKRRWVLAWMLCLAVVLSGCGISGGDQITKMDEKYLAGQESASSQPETGTDVSESSGKPEVSEAANGGDSSQDIGAKGNGSASSTEVQKGNSKKDVPAGQGNSKGKNSPQKSSSPNQGTSSKSTKSPKKSSTSSNQDKLKNSSSETASKKTQTDKDSKADSQKKDTGVGEKEEEKKDSGSISCYISIDCKTILSNLSKLKDSKKEYVPKNGMILNKTKVTVKPGTSVYDVLYQACRDRNIHLEAAYTPMYNTYYVEGIHQLYEFDCGDLSGWNYTVNGIQPNQGCSKYLVKEGDVIAWRYTCDRGKDL